MKITPRCTGLIPKCAAMGTMSGTTTTMAEKMSIRQPTTIRNRLSASRKTHRRLDVRAHPLRHLCRHLRVDQVVGEADGDGQDDEDAADQRNRVAHDPAHVAEGVEFTLDERLDEQREQRRERRRLAPSWRAAEQRSEDHHGHQQFPLRVPRGRVPLHLGGTASRPDPEAMPSRTPSSARSASITSPGSRPPMNRSPIATPATMP